MEYNTQDWFSQMHAAKQIGHDNYQPSVKIVDSLYQSPIPPEQIVEEMFTYHPCKTDERIRKHEIWNDACKSLALLAASEMDTDRQDFTHLLNQIQTARMIGNQIITYEEIGL